MKKSIVLFLCAAILTACATGPRGPYYERASSEYDNGYSEQRLDENIWRVQYRSDYRDPQLAEDWALRRAAELTLDQRYDWFQVLRRSRGFSDDDFRRYDPYGYNNTGVTRAYPDYDDRYNDDSVAVIEVLMGNNPPPRSDSVYDARRVIDYTRNRNYRGRY